MNEVEARELREAWAAVKEMRATNEQWLLMMKQPDEVTYHLKMDYDNNTSPYKTK